MIAQTDDGEVPLFSHFNKNHSSITLFKFLYIKFVLELTLFDDLFLCSSVGVTGYCWWR